MALATASSGATNAAALRSAVPRETVVGLLRDVRGIASATNSRRTYGMLVSHRLQFRVWVHGHSPEA